MAADALLEPFGPADRDHLIAAGDRAGRAPSRPAATRILRFLAAILDQNRRVNLTAVRDPAAALALHAADALGGLALLDRPPLRVADLGTGNGFPGAVVAAVFPSSEVVLIDRTAKKLRAIDAALEQAGIANATTLWVDAAQLHSRAPDRVGAHDLVVCRAVADPATVGKLATPLLADEGRILLWLAEGTAAPSQLPGGRRRVAEREYPLPEPAARLRRVALYA